MIEKLPILINCSGGNEMVTPLKFAEHIPAEFKNVDLIKQKNIHRCYIIFYDNPENNNFLKSLKVVYYFHAGSCITKVFEYKNALIAIAQLGAPAAAILMEELSVFGIDEFIAIGSAGCLNENIKDKFVLVKKAIRDEGLSYHYLKSSTYVSTNKDLNNEIEKFFESNNFEFVKAITWTNDAYYRETNQKVEMAKNLGAVAVEMECSAWCSVAKYRGYKFSQILYFSDLVRQSAWTRLVEQTKGYHNDKRDIVVIIVKKMIEQYCL